VKEQARNKGGNKRTIGGKKKYPKIDIKQYSNGMRFDVVIVLGMHRSGTSALTKALELFGIDLGKDLLGPGHDNPKGYFESAELVALNDRILAKCDSHWTSLQFLEPEILGGPDLAAEKNEARQLLANKISPGIPLGLKDPRLCRTLPFWQELFREKKLRVGYVLSYRHPAGVRGSGGESIMEPSRNKTQRHFYLDKRKTL
jgi:hypothetical protein